ncbi:MAG TPA: FAD-dependent 5-carboxymethylaminomethyl-2-thiouridine(34) oxidoreductase MnmC [Herbaspirillum sp.]|nr:FAD-dependent 5-carboxymethylaminomethyl-2-thiouridine(34) oxidoreductase MnmC [Herbaspirillum sp.]
MPTIPTIAALQDRWRKRSSFTLLDLDFINGRRLLPVAAALLSDSEAPERLHYVAVIDAWPEAGIAASAIDAEASACMQSDMPFAAFMAQLSSAWLPAVPGFQRLVLADGRLVLTLVSGALAASLPQLDLAFDACYCRVADVAPSIILWLGRLAAPQAMLTIDTRDCDASAADGIGEKFASAGFVEAETSADYRALRFAPRHTRDAHHGHRRDAVSIQAVQEKHAIVIGAGLAGAAACHRLSVRGWRCTLIEAQGAPAQQASGNAAGIFMPVLSQDDNPLSRLTRAAYLFALHSWDGLGGVGRMLPGQACGVLQLARSDAASAALTATRMPWPYPADFAQWLDGAQASIALRQRVAGGWWFPAAGWLHPAAVCEAMLGACGDRLHVNYQRQAQRLMHDGEHWHALAADGSSIAHAAVLILANGVQATQFAQTAHLPLRAIRGQVTHLPAQAADLPFVICGDAYLTPALTPAAGGFASLGATYSDATDASLSAQDHQENIRHLQQMLPDWQPPPDWAALDGRAGFRCVAADRLPLVGALPDPDRLAGSGDTRLQDMPRLPGLYGLLAYGSRGLIWSPLAAELLAAQLNGEPAPLSRDLTALLDPARFALKQRRQAV